MERELIAEFGSVDRLLAEGMRVAAPRAFNSILNPGRFLGATNFGCDDFVLHSAGCGTQHQCQKCKFRAACPGRFDWLGEHHALDRYPASLLDCLPTIPKR